MKNPTCPTIDIDIAPSAVEEPFGIREQQEREAINNKKRSYKVSGAYRSLASAFNLTNIDNWGHVRQARMLPKDWEPFTTSSETVKIKKKKYY